MKFDKSPSSVKILFRFLGVWRGVEGAGSAQVVNNAVVVSVQAGESIGLACLRPGLVRGRRIVIDMLGGILISKSNS